MQAILIATVCSMLLLPAAFLVDLPLLPPLDKNTITSMSLALFLILSGKKFKIMPPGPATQLLFAYFLILLISSELNDQPVIYPRRFLPALTHYDAFSSIIRTLLLMMPFFLGRFFLNNIKDNEYIFKFMVTTSLIYTAPMLIEVLISPQLHRMTYGYHASDFIQQMRGSSFRPAVFFGHGLPLAFWFSSCFCTAVALKHNKIRFIKAPQIVGIAFLVFMLFLTNTWSAMIYAGIGFLLITRFKPEKQIKWSIIMALIVLVYPVSKVMNIFPEREIISYIQKYSMDRADSMNTRFVNEEALLQRAMEKPLFGWGGWGRNRVFSKEDGKDLSITDGQWAIEIGETGILGFLIYYAILFTPLFYANKAVRYVKDSKEKVYLACLAVILSFGIVDSVPNSGMTSLHLLLAGALLGQAEAILKANKAILKLEKIKNFEELPT